MVYKKHNKTIKKSVYFCVYVSRISLNFRFLINQSMQCLYFVGIINQHGIVNNTIQYNLTS